jgi:hypothetical protein
LTFFKYIILRFLLTHQDSVFLLIVKSFRGTRISSTPCIINGWFLPTYENPSGFSIQFLFTKFGT